MSKLLVLIQNHQFKIKYMIPYKTNITGFTNKIKVLFQSFPLTYKTNLNEFYKIKI